METSIDASKARNNFFKILSDVYAKKTSYVIVRGGVPVARIVETNKNKPYDIMSFAGIWNDIDADKVVQTIQKARTETSRSNQVLPKIKK